MPTFNTDNYTAQKETRTNPARLQDANVASGSIEFAFIPYTLATTEAAADIINLAVLPAGCIPVPQLSFIHCDADPGTAFTFKVGTAADDDGWAAAPSATVAGKVDFCQLSATQPLWAKTATPIVADTGSGNAVVFATVSTATALNAVGVTFVLAYKRGR